MLRHKVNGGFALEFIHILVLHIYSFVKEKEDYFFLKSDVINMSRARDKEKI